MSLVQIETALGSVTGGDRMMVSYWHGFVQLEKDSG